MALRLLFKYPQDVQVLQASFDHFWIAYCFLEDKTEAIDHAPDQAWRLEDIKEGDELAAHQLEQLCVIDLRVYILAMGNLLFFALSKFVIVTSQFKDVLGKLTRNLRGRTLLILISSVQPEMNLLEHLMHAEAMLKDKHLLKS